MQLDKHANLKMFKKERWLATAKTALSKEAAVADFATRLP
jgi:hypothetical protein